MGLPDPAGSRAVLIGADRYTDPAMEDLPAVTNNLRRLAALFTDPHLWGLPEDNCSVVANPQARDEALDAVYRAAEQATDTLVLYFAGHGLLDERNSELFLALPDATADRLHRAIR